MTMFHYWKTLLTTRIPKSQKGQDLAEYALLIALIALAVIAGVTLLGENILAAFNAIAAGIGLAP
jgi:pilus assembly protein Flp/PilA